MEGHLGLKEILPRKTESITTQNILLVFVLITITVYYVKYLWGRKKLYLYSLQVPGPVSVPVLGNGYLFIGKNPNEIINIIMSLQKEFSGLCKMWLGPKLVYLVSEPRYIDIILNSPNAIDKDDTYALFGQILGDGLLTAQAKKWRIHRRAVSPSFSKKILESFVSIFARKGQIFAQQVEEQVGKNNVNFYPMAIKLTLDIVCETAMGINMNIQTDNKDNVGQVIETVMHIGNERIFKVHYQVPIIWHFSSLKTVFDENVAKLWKYCNELINKKTEMYERDNELRNDSFTESDNDKESKPGVALMDRLLANNNFTKADLKATIQTLMGAATETTASALCVVLTCLGIYPEIQQNVYDEVIEILGPDRVVEAEDITLMKYTDRVIKEALRLFPIAPIFSRKTNDDIDLGDIKIPPDCNVTINSIYNHRSPIYFDDPLKFDPDRFLPEELGKRHPCAYIPFSFGPRNCIGARYAMLNLKTHITILIRKFRIFSEYKSIEEIDLDIQTLLRFKNGYKLRFEKR